MFVDYINTKYSNIRFTFGAEIQNSFSFLDIKIIRNTEKKPFETSVYRKTTFSGILLFFNMFFLLKVLRGNSQAQRNL